MSEYKELVRNIQQHVHFLPVTPDRKRSVNFHQIFPVERGAVYQYEVRARETLNAYDLIILLSVLYVYQNGLAQIEHGGEINNSLNTKLVKIIVPMVRLCKIAGLAGNTRDRLRVWESLERISDASWRWHIMHNGKSTSQKVKILYEVDRTAILRNGKTEHKNYIIIANKQYIKRTKDRKGTLLINFSYMKQCKTDIGKLLIYWLSGQKNNTYQEIILFKALLLFQDSYTPHEARRKLKTALKASTECGYLKEWSIEKRYSTNYYRIER